MEFRRPHPVTDLCGDWKFACEPANEGVLRSARTGSDIEQTGIAVYRARIPGNLELDLLANGLIEEPFRGMNIAGLTRFEAFRVAYWRCFQAEPKQGYDAVLELQGLDCYGTVYLNGKEVARCDNMLVEHRILLSPGDLRGINDLLIVIEPPLKQADGFGYPRLLQAMPANYESLRTRKAPHMYGWDIMPRALSAGLWRPVRLAYLPRERLETVYLETLDIREDGGRATLQLHYQAKLTDHPHDQYEIEIEGRCASSVFHHRHRILYGVGAFRFDVDSPCLWWPRGRGTQSLYECRAVLLHHGQAVDELSFRAGVRTVRLDRTDVTDEAGRGEFCFYVNNERVFVLGTNWVPLDAYHSRDAERVERAVDLVKDIGSNMVRCWGGNVYESDRFYDLCDEAGILVWQDFAMACAIYPQDSEFQDVIRREAKAVVRRLRQHPCVILWAGDNECDCAYLWGGSGVDPNTNVLTRKVLPEVVRNEDPRRPYLPSSPYISPAAMEKGTQYLPEDHLWGPRDYYKGDYYCSALCHFASEIGYHGCPDVASMCEFLSPEWLWPYRDNPEWKLHATSPVPGVDLFDYRVELMARQVRVLFGDVPERLEDFVFASQSSQAEAMKFFIEMFRSQKWRRTGIIWWNIVDGWPQFSDAVVDYYFRPKRAYETIKRSQQPICLVLREPADGFQELVVCNDTRTEPIIRFTVCDVHTDEVLLSGEERVGADVVTVVGRVRYDAGRQRVLLLRWTGEGVSGWNYYLAGEPPFHLGWYRQAMDQLAARATSG